MKIIASIVCDDFDDMEEDEYGEALYDEGICEYISCFTGESTIVTDDGYDEYWKSNERYSGDTIYYISVGLYPTLFKAAYENMDALIAEFRSKLGEYLPEDFDYRANIRHIVGTYWG